MSIILRYRKIDYDITNHVDPFSITTTQSIDGLMNYGKLTIPKISGNIGVLDMSRAIPKYTMIMVDDVYYRVGASTVTQQGNYWRHEIPLISPKQVASRKPLSNMTLTQPKGDIGNYVRSGMNLNDTPIADLNTVSGYKQQGVGFGVVNKVLQYENVTPSIDPGVIDGKILKQAGTEYDINIYLDIYRTIQFALLNPSPDVEVWVKVGNDVIFNERRTMPLARPEMFLLVFPTGKVYPGQWVINRAFKYTPTIPNQEVTITVRGYGKYTDQFGEWDMSYSVVDSQITIYTQSLIANRPKTMEDWVNKVIKDANEHNSSNYILDDASKVKLREFKSPEWTWEEYDLKTGLDEVAEAMGAVFTIDRFVHDSLLAVDCDVIAFKFYDDLERQPIIDIPNAHQITKESDLEDYVSELELNTRNLISDISRPVPFFDGFASLRAINPNTQIDTSNICVKAPFGIYQVTKMIVKGLTITTANRTVIEHDITRRVVEQTRWQALPKASDYTVAGRLFVNANQNNMLYYVEGQDTIFNMGGTGTVAPAFSGSNRSNRAIFEACAAEVSEEFDEVVTNFDNGLSINDNIQVYFEYRSFGESRASVFKEDQSGFVERLSRFYNETARLNDPLALGESAQSTVNRLGNTQITYVGQVANKSELGFIGGLNSKNEKLVILNLQKSKDRINYSAIYSKDFTIKSKHIGIKSPIRQWEVPKNETVTRIIKKVLKFTIGQTSSLNNFNTYHLNILRNLPKVIPSFAHLRFSRLNESAIDVGASVEEILQGNSSTWNLKMKDNYSAGSRKIKTTIASVETTWDEDVRYVDVYGNVTYVNIDFYTRYTTMSLLSRNNYPIVVPNQIQGDLLMSIAHQSDKDAREIYAMTIQRTFISGNDDIIVYNLVKDLYDVKLAVFHYIPSKQSKKVDLGRVTTLAVNNTTVSMFTISATLPSGVTEGYGWYDNLTGDLILFKKGNQGGLQTISYKGEIL